MPYSFRALGGTAEHAVLNSLHQSPELSIKVNRNLRSFITVLILGWSINASASSAEDRKSIVIPGDGKVSICEQSRRGNSECNDVLLPKSIGQISDLLEINSVPNAPISFIVFEKKKLSLCAVTSYRIAHCTPIAAPSMKQIEISLTSGPDGQPHLMFSPEANISKSDGQERVVRFMAALSQAQSRIASALRSQASTKDSDMSGESHLDLVDGGGSCGGSECGNESCDDGDAGGGGGGGGGSGEGGGEGGGNGEGSGTECVYGPITVCKLPPPTPPDVPATPAPATPTLPPISLCGTLGINCPPPTPPVAPIGKNYEERKQQCLDDYDLDMKECSAYYGGYGSNTWRACKTRAGQRLATCLQRAEGK